jgi:hypothetical protein
MAWSWCKVGVRDDQRKTEGQNCRQKTEELDRNMYNTDKGERRTLVEEGLVCSSIGGQAVVEQGCHAIPKGGGVSMELAGRSIAFFSRRRVTQEEAKVCIDSFGNAR